MEHTQNGAEGSAVNTVDELATLVPQATRVTVGGRTLELTPIRVNQIQPITRAITPMLTALRFLLPGVTAADWANLVAEHTGSVVETVAIATRVSKDWLEELTAGELVLLAAKVVEVNADFLMKGVWPHLSSILGVLTGAMGSSVGNSVVSSGEAGLQSIAQPTSGAMPSSA